MTEPKPCPFCGQNYLGIKDSHVYCEECFCTGPLANPGELGIDLWNRRDGEGYKDLLETI